MKIIHIVLGKANPNRMNGVNKVVHQLTMAQHATGMEVEIWGITPQLDTPVLTRPFTTRLFKQQRWPFHHDPKLRTALKQEGQNLVIHFHGGFIPVFAGIAKQCRRLGIPYFVTAHGAYNTIAMHKSGHKKRFYFTFIESVFLKHSRAVHCIGASELEALNNLLPEAHGALIPNGHDLENLKKCSTTPAKPFSFGFCGRLRAHTKGLDILLAAFADYSQKEEGKLVIIGDGEDRENLEAMAKELGLGERVQFLGARYGEEKDKLLAGIDVFLHPSRNEGMPGAVLEAAGLSVPVIISEATNLGKAVKEAEAGLVLDANTTHDLAQAMLDARAAATTGVLQAWARNARSMVASQFAWKRIAALHLNMYQS